MINNKKPQKIDVAYIRENTEEQDRRFAPESQEKNIKEYKRICQRE